ncbi:MAG: ABC transporter substrate-binding protein [Actinomycetota bacterium]
MQRTTPHRPAWLTWLAAILALALLAAACGSSDDDAADDGDASEPASTEDASASATETADEDEEAAETDDAADDGEDAMEEEGGSILRVGLQFGPDAGLAIESDDASILVKAGVVEGLVRSDSSGEPVPALAESWERIDDTTWEFALRSGVMFHDGSAFDAAAVETAIAYITNVASPPRSLGGLALSTEIVDDQTVRVITSDPDPILPLRLSSRSMGILAPAAYNSEPTEPIGTGPFAVTDFTPPDSMTVARFDDYWGDVALLDGAIFRFLPDAGSRAAAIRADEIDVADGIAIPDLEAIEDDADIDLIRFSLPRTASMYANTSSGPMSNVTVREAVSLAIDEVAIAEGLLEGQFAPARGYFGEENAWAPQSDDPADAADQAAALLEGVDADDRSISIWTYGSRPELADIATVAQAQLQAVGFEVDIEVGEYTPLEERVLNGEHDLFVLSRGYYFDIADAGSVFTSDFTCEGGYNLNLYCSEEFDAVVAELSLADSVDDRQALFAQAAQILADDYIGFPLVHDRARYAARTDVQGLVIDPFELTLLTSQVSLS